MSTISGVRADLTADRAASTKETVAPALRPRPRAFGSFRFVLALMVAVHHGLWIGGPVWQGIGEWSLASPAIYGFFVLSGWVVAEANSTFYAGRPVHFMANRVLRIDPPYHASLLLSVVIHLAIAKTSAAGAAVSIPEDVFGLGNLAGNTVVIWLWHGLTALGIAPSYYFVKYCWTLAVETKFYVFMTLVYLVARRAGAIDRRWWPMVLKGGLLVLLAGHVLYWYFGSRLFEDFEYMPYFVLGMCGYYAIEMTSRWHAAAALAALVLMLPHYPVVSGVGPSSIAIFVGALAVMAGLAFVTPRGRFARIDQHLGDLTYFLYLNHFVVLVLFMAYGARSDVTALTYLPAAIAFSWASRFLTEPWTGRLRERIRGARL